MTQAVVDTLVAVDSLAALDSAFARDAVAVTGALGGLPTFAILAAVVVGVGIAFTVVNARRSKNTSGGGSSNEPPTDNPREQ
jgi:hypothetical protein